jgi:outer membrane immunogenic protein
MRSRIGIFGLTLAGVAAFTAFEANAADLSAGGYKDGPAVPVATWTGFYAGINAGAGWGEQRLEDTSITPLFTGVQPGGAFGGGQIGYNWQGGWGSPNVVLGVEADIQGSDMGDKQTDASNTFKSGLDYFGTVRGRIGYASDRSLYYATAGLAYGGITNEADLTSGRHTDSTTAVGYAVGGGIEMKTGHNWSIKAEYQYINLGANDPVYTGGKAVDDDYHTIRAGLNYHLGPSYEPLK